MFKKPFIIILLLILFISCNHLSRDKRVKHKVIVPIGETVIGYYIISDIQKTDNCIRFTCISNYDFESIVNKEICGSYIIEY